MTKSNQQRGPWTKFPRRNIWVHNTRGYVVEQVCRGVWDAYLPAHILAPGEIPDYRQTVWSSPRHRNFNQAVSICEMEIRRINKGVREACGVQA